MMIFRIELYDELATEIVSQTLGRQELIHGAVEIVDGDFEFILGFSIQGIYLQRWLVIAFDNGVRCSTDFDVEILRRRLGLQN